MSHRPEIDGLRTVAVLPVLLSHAGFALFRGGYVGVDVFFVISGFLITGLILNDLNEGRFSILGFYERRARRILPAGFSVMMVSVPLALHLMSADALENFGQSIVATILFANNYLLKITSGYWEMESKFKPLLHTWSLGVEEQYYFIVPFLMLLVYRISKQYLIQVYILIGIASFMFCFWSVQRSPVSNFYLLPTRAWEIVVGGIAAIWIRDREAPDSDGLASLGLAMIAAAVLFFEESLPTPSAYTLLPVTGAAMILVYCRSGFAHALLSSSVMSGLGLISYSTYLWHQPLFAFLRIASPLAPPLWQFVVAIILTLILAYLTWRFVEEPFRNRETFSVQRVAAIIAPVGAGLLCVGLLMYVSGGLPQRFDRAEGGDKPGTYKAYNMSAFKYKRDSFNSDSSKNLLVLGNSTGRDFVNMVLEVGRLVDYDMIYRDDLNLCNLDNLDEMKKNLISSATLIVRVYPHVVSSVCDGKLLETKPELHGKLVFVGPKDFGVNINPFSRLPLPKRATARVAMSDEVLKASELYRSASPHDSYVDIIHYLSVDGRTVPIFDDAGRILSEDRVHVTRAGAKFVGKRIFEDPIWAGFSDSGSEFKKELP